MSALPDPKRWTVEEYLKFELTSDTKHEYFNGEVYAMAGASEKHNRITANTIGALVGQLRHSDCNVLSSDQRVKVSSIQYVYPDVTVVCDDPSFSGEKPDTLVNPTLLIEVLSPSTEGYDRNIKSEYYRAIESLQEYVLISQEKCHIEHYVRQANGRWVLTDIFQLDGKLDLPSISCALAAADVYNKVNFDNESS
ncbi:MAG: Uma2 family endonuclease [Anaerolineae bacterium]